MENKKPTWSVKKTENKTQVWRHSKIPLVAVFIAGILLGAVVVYSQTPAQSLTISGGIYPNGVSYTLWVESGTYYAKSASGSIDYSSTNASSVFYNCIDALPNGGTLFVKSGDYTIDDGVSRGVASITCGLKIQQDNIIIYGEGKATRFLPESKYQRIFTIWGVDNCALYDLCVDGNGVYTDPYPGCTDTMIAFDENASRGTVERVYALNGVWCDGMGTFACWNIEFRNNYVRNCALGIAMTQGLYNKAINNYVLYCDNGIVVGAEGVLWTKGNEVIGNTILNCSTNGIGVINNSSHVTIANNYVGYCEKGIHVVTFGNTVIDNHFENNERYGICIGYPTYTTADENIVANNVCLFTSNASYGWGIYEFVSCDYNIFSSNSCFNNVVGGIFVNGTNTHVIASWNETTWVSTYP